MRFGDFFFFGIGILLHDTIPFLLRSLDTIYVAATGVAELNSTPPYSFTFHVCSSVHILPECGKDSSQSQAHNGCIAYQN